MTQRTDLQNKSLHVYCELLAEGLNDAGFEMKAFLGRKQNTFILTVIESIRELLNKAEDYINNCPEADIPWDKDSVKKHIVKPVIKAKYDITSTTKLSRSQINETYEITDRFTSEKFGVHIPFPQQEK